MVWCPPAASALTFGVDFIGHDVGQSNAEGSLTIMG